MIPDTQGQPNLDRESTLSRLDSYSPEVVAAWLKAKGLRIVTVDREGEGQTDMNPTLNAKSVEQDLDASLPAPQERVRSEVAVDNSHLSTSNASQERHTARPTNSRTAVNVIETVDLTIDEASEQPDAGPTSNTIKFSNQGIEAHGLVALSKYFAAKMTALDSYIPLSVFNTQWLRQDLLQQSLRKRSVKEKLEDSYIGLTVPLEWKMTFGEWVVAFDLFITYLEYYKWSELAAKFKGHKENVFAVKRENSNWPVAFRYDLAVRTAVMTFRLPDGSVANPSIRDARIEREAIRETERLKDFLPAFKEVNPYADGEVKAFVDPITGVDSRARQHPNNQGFNKPTHRSQSFSQQATFNNLPVYDGPGGIPTGPWEDRRSDNTTNRFRNRRGSWHGNQVARDRPHQRRRLNGESDGWRREDRREDNRSGDRNQAEQPGKSK